MSEETVTIEVDGITLEARKGAMLIEATDAGGIYIPRFCYHKKLSIAANCRMCLVEVERAPKPLPACATPVADGMKVFTRSEKAVQGQQATMEFLLINHPLDCPICDQGGECELQDLALGYGSDVSQYSEGKRVVRDKDIGPLVQTDMTRCIHCTRCVRFGEEIAGLRELGATGRGENMEIGTYVAHAMQSELSGNVIDLCPVGALTSKPYRYSARAWELQQHDSIAPHDCVGSNVHLHCNGQTVKRVVPKENTDLNEMWLSDRDRFSYDGLNSHERLQNPRIKRDCSWQDVTWEQALDHTARVLRASDPQQLGALVQPSATVEECYLLQCLLRGLGSDHIDSRLRERLTDVANDGSMPGLDLDLNELERADSILILGGYPRHDQPMLNHRIRRAAGCGARVITIHCLDLPYNFERHMDLCVTPASFAATLQTLLRGLRTRLGQAAENSARGEVDEHVADKLDAIAAALLAGERRVVLGGNYLLQHEHADVLSDLRRDIATTMAAHGGQLCEGANAVGAFLAGAVPHCGVGGRPLATPGLSAESMLSAHLKVYCLLGLEPDRDLADPQRAQQALANADSVIAWSAYSSPALESVATVMLPIALYAENEGSYINLQRQWQSFDAAVRAPGEARPAWKILRMLGHAMALDGFTAFDIAAVTQAARVAISAHEPNGLATSRATSTAAVTLGSQPDDGTLELIRQVPMYRVDPLVRRAQALQKWARVENGETVYIHPHTAASLALTAGTDVQISSGGCTRVAALVLDEATPPGCCHIDATSPIAAALPLAPTAKLTRAH